jgi:site-specific DNA-methyltransferase (adenine-specific)
MEPLEAGGIELTWAGKHAPRAALASELSLVKSGHPSCMLIEGDNLQAMLALAARAHARVTLAYLDPPFLTGKTHLRITRERRGRGKILRTETPAFEDRWSSLSEYLSALRDRISAARDLLLDHGSLILHVDSKTSHYAKIVCDEVFGPRCFASEIVWRYRRWPSKTQNFQRVHDVLLRFVKDPQAKPRFHQLYEPLAPSTLATWGTAKQRAVVGPEGVRTHSSSTSDPSPGTPLGDVWDIGIVGPVSRERTGYPTQKPEALLERIIQSCSDPGDLVLDPYAGSGTALAVATRLERRVIGIDVGGQALDVIRTRLGALGIAPLEERVTPLDPSLGKPLRRSVRKASESEPAPSSGTLSVDRAPTAAAADRPGGRRRRAARDAA